MKVLIRRDTAPRASDKAASAARFDERSWSHGFAAKDAWCCLVLFSIVIAVFWKTVFLQLPISRIGLIAEWDSLFAALSKGATLHIDPSAVLLALPTYTAIAAQYHLGGVPLWNSLNAFGSPLVGDIQATVFSPLRLLFNIWPTMQTYNLQLVFQVQLAAITTYLLSRRLGATAAPAMCAALGYALCPFVLWYLELQSGVGYVLNPLVLWLFVRAAYVRSNKSALLAGFGAGCTILMGHPETSFFAIVFASLSTVILLAPCWLTAARILALAASAAFCTCAPTFLPFLEFARNSDCYKYAVTESAYMPWQAMLANLCTPVAAGASPFMGPFVAAFAFLSYSAQRKKAFIAMATVAVLSFILSAKLWPLSLVACKPPFNYLITVYAVPLFLLAVATLAALGLTQIASVLAATSVDVRRRAMVVSVYTLGVVLTAPLLWHVVGTNWQMANFDLTLAPSAFRLNVWVKDVLLTLAGMGLLGVVCFRPRAHKAFLLTVVILNSISVVVVSRQALPAQPHFELPKIAAMDFLRQSGERCLVVGTHLAKPDVNLLYGVDDVRSINAMLPPRYVEFIKSCGASTDQFTQWFPDEVTSLIDYGSVKYVLSQTPVTSAADAPLSQTAIVPRPLATIGQLSGGALSTDGGNLQTCGYVKWQLDPAKKLLVSFCLVNPAGQVVWFGDREAPARVHKLKIPLLQPVSDEYSIQAQLFDGVSGNIVAVPNERSGRIFISYVPPPQALQVPRRLKLIKQFDGGIRLYENLSALPRAYLATSAVCAGNAAEALATMRDPSFPAGDSAVLENESMLPAPGVGSKTESRLKVISRSACETTVVCSSNSACLLVVTDTFYPGWKAFVDGKRSPIVRCNYLFRAVAIPAGSHKVTMRYYPETFSLGVLLFFAFWGCTLVVILKAPRRQLEPAKTTQRELVAKGDRKAL